MLNPKKTPAPERLEALGHAAVLRAAEAALSRAGLKPQPPVVALSIRGRGVAASWGVGKGNAVGVMHFPPAENGRSRWGMTFYAGFRHKGGWVIPWEVRASRWEGALPEEVVPVGAAEVATRIKQIPAVRQALDAVEVPPDYAAGLLMDACQRLHLLPAERVVRVVSAYGPLPGNTALDLLACFWEHAASRGPACSRANWPGTPATMPACVRFYNAMITEEP